MLLGMSTLFMTYNIRRILLNLSSKDDIMILNRKCTEKKEGNSMTAQIAATPVVKGNEALKILEEANRLPSKKALRGEKKLERIFSKIIK